MGALAVFLGVFGVSVLIYAACMAVGTRFAGGGGSFLHLLAIAAIGGVLNAIPIPIISWMLAIGVMLYLLHRWVGVDAYPEGVFIIVIAWALNFLVQMLLIGALYSAFGGA